MMTRLFLCFVLLQLIIINSGQVASSPTVLTICTPTYIRIQILFEEGRQFFGRIHTRPNRGTCGVVGSGEDLVNLFVPLEEPGMSECGVALTGGIYSTVINVLNDAAVEQAQDSSFLIQCSARDANDTKVFPQVVASLQIFDQESDLDLIAAGATVGQVYTVQISLPKSDLFYRVSNCVAFSGYDTIQFISLLDFYGCPVDSIMTAFRPTYTRGVMQSQLTMFKFNDSQHFHIQCTILQCLHRCAPIPCASHEDGRRNSAQILATPHKELLTSKRLAVRDQSQVTEKIVSESCSYGSSPKLVTLTIFTCIFAAGTVFLSFSAVMISPFRCKFQLRDDGGEPVLINQFKIVDEVQQWRVGVNGKKSMRGLPWNIGRGVFKIVSITRSRCSSKSSKSKSTKDSASVSTISSLKSSLEHKEIETNEACNLDNSGKMNDVKVTPPGILKKPKGAEPLNPPQRSINFRESPICQNILSRKPPLPPRNGKTPPKPPPRIDSMPQKHESPVESSSSIDSLPPPPPTLIQRTEEDPFEEEDPSFPPPPSDLIFGQKSLSYNQISGHEQYSSGESVASQHTLKSDWENGDFGNNQRNTLLSRGTTTTHYTYGSLKSTVGSIKQRYADIVTNTSGWEPASDF